MLELPLRNSLIIDFSMGRIAHAISKSRAIVKDYLSLGIPGTLTIICPICIIIVVEDIILAGDIREGLTERTKFEESLYE